MALISEEFHKKKLDKYNINIKTNYAVGHQLLERNTNNSKNDDIYKGVRIEKKYYINDVLKHTEKDFDTRIEYTFISKEQEEKEHKCPNCGMKSKIKDSLNGCSYCGTYYNVDYVIKDLGSKYHYDHILKSNTYKIITAIIDIILSLIISYVYIKSSSRTFNGFDFSKVFIYGGILSLVSYYFFYIIDAYIVLTPIKKYKDKQNIQQIKFWKRMKFDKNKFFNNLNYELRRKYYSSENIIDYDILDYISFDEYEKDNILYVSIKADVRLVYLEKGKIYSKQLKQTYLMKKHNGELAELKEGANVINCVNCGASINVNKESCEYCNTPNKYLQEWVLVDIK